MNCASARRPGAGGINRQSLRDERAAAIKERDSARDTFLNAEPDDKKQGSEIFKAAQEAVKTVGELEDQIADLQAEQVMTLKLLGQSESRIRQINRKR